METRAAALVGILCLRAFAQPSAPSAPEPPTWPGANGITVKLEHQYVFVTPERDALIVRAPPDSDYARSGKPGIIRYDLHNRLNPSVAVTVSLGQDTKYIYEYTVGNGASAADAIGMWDVIIPAGQEAPKVICEKWCGGPSAPPIFRQVEMPDQPKGRLIMWTRPNEESSIPPAQSQRGFHLESACRPGFTTALFSSGIWVNIDQDLPDEVFRQLDFYNDPTWGKIPALTLGPMFCVGSSHQLIAQNMISGIKRLLDTHELDPKSRFLEEVLARLESVIRGDLDQDTSIAHAPSGEREVEIGRALELSLGLKMPAP